MAKSAVAREAVLSLRREIARIEGRPAERLAPPPGAVPASGEVVLRDGGVVRGAPAGRPGLLATGAEGFDAALGGGLPGAGLTELHGRAMREAGAAAGFALGLAAIALAALGEATGRAKRQARPLLAWIGLCDGHAEAGFPHAPGIARNFGIGFRDLLLAETQKLADALWIAEEAARLDEPCLVLLELRGNPKALDLTATRRLHLRAAEAGRPFLLVRHSAEAEPTAAPVRLLVAPAPAAGRPTLAGPPEGTPVGTPGGPPGGSIGGSIGAPRFRVAVGKGPRPQTTPLELEWSCHDRLFRHAGAQIRRPVVSLSAGGEDLAPAARPQLARRAG